MKRFVQGADRTQSLLLPEALDDYVAHTNPVRVVDVFVDELDLHKLGFDVTVFGTNASAKRSRRWHSTTNWRQTLRIALPLSLRNHSNGLEVRCQATYEPHQFDVALSFAFKATTGLNAVQVTVDVDFEHHARMIRRPTC